MTKKVVVADDSPTIQQFIRLALADEDISVECIADGEQAVEKVKILRPDIVLADVHMPGVNGYEICSTVKNDPELADTRVVLMVGTFESFDEEAAARVRCDAHLTKPFDTSELLELTRSLMPGCVAGTAADKPENAQESLISSGKMNDLDIRASMTPVSPKTKESFMGSGHILELFTEQDVRETKSPQSRATGFQSQSTAAGKAEIEITELGRTMAEPEAAPAQENIQPIAELPDAVVERIVEKVVRRMSQEVIREIAWEVVPELSDVIIRQRLEELENKP
jgi:CheY-like chemotaxis protein